MALEFHLKPSRASSVIICILIRENLSTYPLHKNVLFPNVVISITVAFLEYFSAHSGPNVIINKVISQSGKLDCT